MANDEKPKGIKFRPLLNTVIRVEDRVRFFALMGLFESAGWRMRDGVSPLFCGFWKDNTKVLFVEASMGYTDERGGFSRHWEEESKLPKNVRIISFDDFLEFQVGHLDRNSKS